MKLIDIINSFKRNKTASIAKERLQIVVSHERIANNTHDILPELRQELMEVINKYYPIEQQHIKVELQRDGTRSILELNVTLPDKKKKTSSSKKVELVAD